jgi:hypothetical protein
LSFFFPQMVFLQIHASGASPRTGMSGGGGGGGGGGGAAKGVLSSEGNGVIYITVSAGSPPEPRTATGAPGTGTIFLICMIYIYVTHQLPPVLPVYWCYVCVCFCGVKRDLVQCQKRPSTVSKET